MKIAITRDVPDMTKAVPFPVEDNLLKVIEHGKLAAVSFFASPFLPDTKDGWIGPTTGENDTVAVVHKFLDDLFCVVSIDLKKDFPSDKYNAEISFPNGTYNFKVTIRKSDTGAEDALLRCVEGNPHQNLAKFRWA